MIGRFLFGLCAAAYSVLALYGDAVATTKNVDVVVTHNAGSVLTTYTVQETSGKSQPAGMVYIAGQSFRRGDLPPGTYPVFRDAKTHTPLVQQLDEIATRRENGDDGSIRHLVFSVQLPAIPANGTYTMEIVRQSGTYSATAKQSLAALAKAHDLKLHLTDVRNQDASTRGSGSLTFDINVAASNTGRDAPRKCATGPVRDCWIVVGPPIDDVTHKPDPLLYVACYLDLTTSASDQNSLGPVRHVCRVDNSWMNVSASNGGFSHDPQAISYRPQLLDGSSNLLDWSWLDATVNSSSNPITLNGDGNTACNATLASKGNWNIPASAGANSWYFGQPVFYSTSGTPPAGLTNNKLYFVMPVGAGYSQGGTTNYNIVRLENVPFVCAGNNRPYEPVITSQGSGNQTFSFRVWHTHWMSWYAVDQTGLENWTSGTARASSPLLPQFSAQEQLYWKQTGTVPPLRLTQTPSDPTSYGNWLTNYYEPLSRNNIIGGSGVGGRSDLGLVNEYWAQAFLLETPTAWQRARVFSLGSTHYPYGSLLNEATGRIPVINNGPPAANHGGSGSPYPTLGAPHPQIYIGDNSASDFNNVIQPLEDIPVNTGTGMRYTGGIWGGGRVWANDHDPSFGNGMYTIFGSRHYIDALYFNGNRAGYVVTYGGVGYTDAIVAGVHYYGLYYDSYNERRGGFWAFREKMLPAALGGDSNPERTYFNDQLAENYWYGVALEASLDGSGNYRNSIAPPGEVNSEIATFMDGYGFMVSYQAYAMLRDPVASIWLPRWLRTYRAMCDETVPGHLSSYYCALYYYEPAVHDVSLLNNYLVNSTWGSAFNGSDASDVGTDEGQYQMFTAGSGTIQQQTAVLTLTNGDTVKFKGCGAPGCDSGPGPDQLRTDIWYTITNVNNATGTYQIINPSTGMPFASFTKGGSPLSGGYTMKLRPQYAPTTGWQHASYVPYAQALVYGLKDLGFSAINTAINVMTNRGFVDPGPTLTNMNWDPNVVVP